MNNTFVHIFIYAIAVYGLFVFQEKLINLKNAWGGSVRLVELKGEGYNFYWDQRVKDAFLNFVSGLEIR